MFNAQRLLPVIASALTPMLAHGQQCGYSVTATPVVSPSNPEAHIEVYAWFDRIPGQAELFCSGQFNLLATDPAFTRLGGVPGVVGPNPRTTPFTPTAMRLLRVTQFHFPPTLPGSPASPLLVFQAWWRPDNFTPRTVTLTVEASNPNFEMYRSMQSSEILVYPSLPQPGQFQIRVEGPCYADCDTGTGVNVLDIFDFLCFQNRYEQSAPYACDCDTTTGPGLCDIFDFLCFQNEFAAGCP